MNVCSWDDVMVANVIVYVHQSEKEQLATELVEEREKLENAKRQEDSVQEALNNSVAIFNQRQDEMQKEINHLKAELFEEQRRYLYLVL